MTPSPFDVQSVLSFRSLLTETAADFLDERQMSSPETAEALSELVVTLSTYREEGLPLFPQVFLMEDINDITTLKGFDLRRISEGDRSRETMRRALKQCAPLCRGGWSIYFELCDPGRFNYGLFRTDNSILASTPVERLRGTAETHCRILGISRLAENIIELSASAGYRRFIHLSGARADVPHPTEVVEAFVKAITADVRLPAGAMWGAAAVETFFRHVFYDVMQAPYGCLAMVVPAGAEPSDLMADGVMLDPQIDVMSALGSYFEDPSAQNATALQSVATLLKGMLSADGITVIRSDASLVGYNVFVSQQTARAGGTPIGGARLRSYNVLRQHIGQDLSAAFYRSQDGVALCDTIFLRQAQASAATQTVQATCPPCQVQGQEIQQAGQVQVPVQAAATSAMPPIQQAMPPQVQAAQVPMVPAQMQPQPAMVPSQLPQQVTMVQQMQPAMPGYGQMQIQAPTLTPTPLPMSPMPVQIQMPQGQAPMQAPRPMVQMSGVPLAQVSLQPQPVAMAQVPPSQAPQTLSGIQQQPQAQMVAQAVAPQVQTNPQSGSPVPAVMAPPQPSAPAQPMMVAPAQQVISPAIQQIQVGIQPMPSAVAQPAVSQSPQTVPSQIPVSMPPTTPPSSPETPAAMAPTAQPAAPTFSNSGMPQRAVIEELLRNDTSRQSPSQQPVAAPSGPDSSQPQPATAPSSPAPSVVPTMGDKPGSNPPSVASQVPATSLPPTAAPPLGEFY